MEGSTISHYKILEKLGSGGMGDVWKAEDTKLHREVALKLLASHLLRDEEARKRFHREAQAAAALSHPNVTTIYEIDEADGKTFLALEYIEGETLEQRIEQGPLGLQDALDIAQQIAEGLQAAHAKGIVHRDIKPGNILITPDGRVKILDFGLALLTEGSKLTNLDTTVGTVAYMSPEQTQGSGTDHRTDIWALGVVLYEMVTGQQPFKGDYDKAVMYSILNEEHEPITAVRAGLPMELEVLVGKCLEKDQADRYRSAADIAIDARNLGKRLESGRSAVQRVTSGGVQTKTDRSPASGELPAQSRLPWALAGVATVLAAVLAVLYFAQSPPERPVRRFAITPEGVAPDSRDWLAVSPDGKRIAYAAGLGRTSLWVRDLDSLEPRQLPQTAGGSRPFWSPDSQNIGFGTETQLMKVSLQGGAPIQVCALPAGNFQGGAWSPDGERIVFSSGGPASLYEVSAAGGEAEPLVYRRETELDGGLTSPYFLPTQGGPGAIVFDAGDQLRRTLTVMNLNTGEWQQLGRGAASVYASSGHILYQTDRYEPGVWALPFSPETLEPVGDVFPVDQDAGAPSVSDDGTLVAMRSVADFGMQQLGWRDRAGNSLGLIGEPQELVGLPWLSPDGRHVAALARAGGVYRYRVGGFDLDIWVYDLDRSIQRRLTSWPSSQQHPRCTPSGDQIVFSSPPQGGGDYDIFIVSADGTGEPELLVSSAGFDAPSSWSRDGKYLLHVRSGSAPGKGDDIWYLERNADGDGFEAHPFLESEHDESTARISPDGRFVAYTSNHSGEVNVYVRPFPGRRRHVANLLASGRPTPLGQGRFGAVLR